MRGCVHVRMHLRVCSEVRTLRVRVRQRTRTCVYTCACACIFVCLRVHLCTQSVHTGVRARVHVCERVRGMRACTSECVFRICSCIISALEIFSGVGLHVLKATLLILKL